VEQKGGPTFEYLGASPASPDLCRIQIGGETAEGWYGIWLTSWPGAEAAYPALTRVMRDGTGSVEAFDVRMAPGYHFHDLIRNEGYDIVCASRYMRGGRQIGGPRVAPQAPAQDARDFALERHDGGPARVELWESRGTVAKRLKRRAGYLKIVQQPFESNHPCPTSGGCSTASGRQPTATGSV